MWYTRFDSSSIPINDSTHLNKRACYTPDPPPVAIYVASRNYASTLIKYLRPSQVILLTRDAPETDHTMTRDEYDCRKAKRGYCDWRYYGIGKKLGSIDTRVILKRGIINVMYL